MEQVPKSFGGDRYAVVRLLGEGGQAATFEAVDKRGGRLVAVKRFRVRGAQSWKEVELAEREARVLASISHPLLPRYVDHFEENGELFLVTEKIDGQSLGELCRDGKRLGEADVRELLRAASDALDYLHGRAPPIIHRDLKPSNVIRRPDGSFAFIDFGAVRDRMRPEGGSTVVGTFGYMAPEQFQGRAMPASDVYAIGATALRVLTGREPEELPHRGLAIDVGAALAGGGASPALARVLSSMLAPDPDARAARIAPLLADLDGAPKKARARPSPGAPWPHVAEQARRPGESLREGVARQAEALREGALRQAEALRDELRRQVEAQSAGVHRDPEPSRAAVRRASRDAREERRRRKHERRERRRERALQRIERGGPSRMPAVIALVVVLALTMAQIAVIFSLRVVVPLALVLLSIVFGKPLRDAAGSVGDAGQRAADALGRARDAIRGGAPPADHPSRLRIDADPRAEARDDGAVDREAEDEAAEAEAEAAERRREGERRGS